MAATESDNPTPASPTLAPAVPLTASELTLRLREEVSRAIRHRTPLSCLLVSLEDAEGLARSHGEQFPRQALAYLGAALRPELRDFDRVGHGAEGELLVLLPGADEQRGEVVARRALSRLHAVKLEVAGQRRPLRISVGIAAWRDGLSGEQLLRQTRLAAHRTGAHDYWGAPPTAPPTNPPTDPPGSPERAIG